MREVYTCNFVSLEDLTFFDSASKKAPVPHQTNFLLEIRP